MEEVILVDENDNEVGTMEKMEAHTQGLLHRAYSVFIFNSNGELLLQQRAFHKYHSAGLWANTCCSHPRPGENVVDSAQRRLMEEMGMKCELIPAFSFIYKIELANNITEHELDHVLIGFSDKKPVINAEEVSGWKYMKPDSITTELKQHPATYAYWFSVCFENVMQYLNRQINHSADQTE
ncbi:MAG: isopentenyl-diphosphate Delta-isomerase [Flavobacteriales bacterium]